MDNSALFTDSKKLTFKMNSKYTQRVITNNIQIVIELKILNDRNITNYEDETQILPVRGIKLGNFCR